MAGIQIEQDAWVLVGDGEKALVFRNEGDAKFPNLKIIRILEQENPPTRDHGAGAPGRRSDGPGPQKSSMEQTDWHTLEKHRFAKTMAEAQPSFSFQQEIFPKAVSTSNCGGAKISTEELKTQLCASVIVTS